MKLLLILAGGGASSGLDDIRTPFIVRDKPNTIQRISFPILFRLFLTRNKNENALVGITAVPIRAAPVASAKVFSFAIVNKTSGVVEKFYASPTDASDWEEDLLGDDAIPPGGRYQVRFKDKRGACQYDLRFEFRDERFETLEDTQNLCRITEYELTE
ncbi:hypothetical protein [Pusillimonas sp. (ex Stolz et al. 2005)]|uniref:hypothetical protein n=1 Tax=Pusillimonas sp. (ex Stolz et al. 2005) TaxID=1979962 RepID=UPI00260FB48F|nr:hypothetical protein [Pusillimonas sp. (ex Stolz et al. 2005)]